MTRLKVALMGLTGEGAEYLAALRSDDRLDLIAVADTQAEALRRCTETTGIRGYDDYRSFIVETAQAGLDSLFVALEPFQSSEFLPLAADRHIAVFHQAPFARTVREAVPLVQRFEEAACPLIVARRRPFGPAPAELRRLLEQVGHVYAATARVETADAPVGWRGDSARAGGGVLLHGAYEVLDMLVRWLGPVESVFAQCAVQGALGAPRSHDTEDMVAVVLRLANERIAALTAVRGAAQPARSVVVYGTEGKVRIEGEQITITPRDDGSYETHSVDSPIPSAIPVLDAIRTFTAARLLEQVPALSNEPRTPGMDATRQGPDRTDGPTVDAVKEPTRDHTDTAATNDPSYGLPTGRDHLPTMAVIEAAYLSAKTGAPETPARVAPPRPQR